MAAIEPPAAGYRISTGSWCLIIAAIILTVLGVMAQGPAGNPPGLAGVAIAAVAGADPVTHFVSPTGSGSDCTQASPCGSINVAFAVSSSGGQIDLLGGSYPDQTVSANAAAAQRFAQNVVVEPAPGARVVLGGLVVKVAHITLEGLSINGYVGVQTANYLKLLDNVIHDNMIVDSSDHAVISGNEIYGGNDVEGVQISGGDNDVTFDDNYVHDFSHTNPNVIVHVDCLHIFDASNVVVQGNRLARCSVTELMIEDTGAEHSPAGAVPTHDITVMDNTLQPCTQAEQPTCENPGGTVLNDVNFGRVGYNWTFYHNDFESYVQMDVVPGMQVRDNILAQGFLVPTGYSSICATSDEDYNLIGWKDSCSSVSPHDRLGAVSYAEPASSEPDPNLAPGSYATVAGFGDPADPTVADFTGKAFLRPPSIGAEEAGYLVPKPPPPPAQPSAAPVQVGQPAGRSATTVGQPAGRSATTVGQPAGRSATTVGQVAGQTTTSSRGGAIAAGTASSAPPTTADRRLLPAADSPPHPTKGSQRAWLWLVLAAIALLIVTLAAARRAWTYPSSHLR